MRLLIYLRRSLVGLRAGVRGPLLDCDLPVVERACGFRTRLHLLAFVFGPGCSPNNFDRSYRVLHLMVKPNRLDDLSKFSAVLRSDNQKTVFVHELLRNAGQILKGFHGAILQAVPQKRRRPFVLAFAGGKA